MVKLLTLLVALLIASPSFAVVDPVGRWTFDEGTGTTAADSGSGGNNGTLLGSAGWGAGNVGAFALSTNGTTGNVVDVGDPGSGNLDFGTGSFSFSLWFKTSDTTNTKLLLTKRFSGSCISGDEGYYFIMDSGGQFFTSVCDGTTGFTTSTAWTGKSDNAWHHAVVIIDRGANLLKLYGDNVLIGSNTDITGLGSLSNTRSLIIGGSNFNEQVFNGLIDDVRIYNRVLTVGEIGDMFNQTEGTVTKRTIGPIVVW